ncbi:Conserved_hypothetical protein [Hexamita inflata]|uniref:Uncharacterized protein n=1 Tax=Hexamita inflata TaxID=28002 RepID=A0AA86UQ30_9EUKA|nr:Conserved hypothetical protein [Hexamita inflata]
MNQQILQQLENFELKSSSSLYVLPQEINWSLAGDMQKLWADWAGKQEDIPLGFANILKMKYLDSNPIDFSIKYLVLHFNITIQYELDGMISQTNKDFIYVKQPEMSEILPFQARGDKLNPVRMLISKMVLTSLPDLNMQSESVQFTGEISDLKEQITNFCTELMKMQSNHVEEQRVKFRTVQICPTNQYLVKVPYLIQGYVFDKTQRFIIVNLFNGTIFGEASVSKSKVMFNKMFKK